MDGLIALALAKKAIGTSMGDIATNLDYKGSVNSQDDLPTDATAGDMYGVGTEGLYVWNGSEWGAIGRTGPRGEKGEKGEKGAPGDGKGTVYYQEDEPVSANDNDIWIVKPRLPEYLDYLYFRKPENAPDDLSACYVQLNYTDRSDLNIEYSFDKQNWEPADLSAPYTIDLLEVGADEVYFRGTNECIYVGSGRDSLFVCSCLVGEQEYGMECGGNVNTLLSYEHDVDTIPDDCFAYTFSASNIISAPYLPALAVGQGAYREMFCYCQLLTTPPAILPATTLSFECYSDMFEDCTSLTEAPELPAMVLAERCYNCMFLDCYELRTPPALPATELAKECYNCMFNYCYALETAPILSATELAEGCYQGMFWSCSALASAPALPAVSLAKSCYEQMFDYCEALVNAPELPATTLAESCYQWMFAGCESLTNAPELPAMALADHCYYQMFYGCTSLVNAPELPATTLADYCYREMFASCASLANVNVSFIDWEYVGSYSPTHKWLDGVAEIGTFTCPAALDTSVRDVHHVPAGWTIVTV